MKKDCTCAKCIDRCRKNPGWFAPKEAIAAVHAGLANKMMRDWLDPSSEVGNTERLYVLSPACDDRGGKDAPEWEDMHGYTGSIMDMFSNPYKGCCVFLKNDRCEIHNSGFKPMQCVSCYGCDASAGDSNYDMAKQWDSKVGQAALALWESASKAGKK